MKNIKKFNDFKKINENAIPETEELNKVDSEVEKKPIDIENPIDVENTTIGSESSEYDVELENEAKHQQAIALQKGLKQISKPDNHMN